MNVLCTLPLFHLPTCDHNLYTFAQSTRCLYINSYFMSHLIFFIHVHTVCQMLQDNVKEIETYYPNDSMCVYVSECYDFITPIFQCERNKSSCKNGAWMDNVYVNHRCIICCKIICIWGYKM